MPPAPIKTTLFAPAACPDSALYRKPDGTPLETDGDGLWDCWEDGARWADGRPGIDIDVDGVRDVLLCASVDTTGDGVVDAVECAHPSRKNVFVEIDFMQDADGSKSHRPDPLALLAVRNAFAGAPVSNPNASTGISLHVHVDDVVPHGDVLAFEPCTRAALSSEADFDKLKASFFGTAVPPFATPTEKGNTKALLAKSFGFRYVLFGHTLAGTTASGCSELPGNDSTVTLGKFGPLDPSGHQRGTTDQQAGTFMHELGHALGLRHGGGDNVNCKPNFLSVMSYSRQFTDFVTNRPLDYSREKLTTLLESSLAETLGIGTLNQVEGEKTVYSVPNSLAPPVVVLLPNPVTGIGISWNGDSDAADTVAADVNRLAPAGCDGEGAELVGHNDWQNLVFNARASIEFASGVRTTAPPCTTPSDPHCTQSTTEQDKDPDQELASFQQADYDGDGVGDAFACGGNNGVPAQDPCAIDIKPGENPNVLRKGSEANISVAILQVNDFDPLVQVVRSSLTLNEIPVKINPQNNQGTCNTVTSTNGRVALACQFPADALPLGTNYSIIEGLVIIPGGDATPRRFRARDVVTVVK